MNPLIASIGLDLALWAINVGWAYYKAHKDGPDEKRARYGRTDLPRAEENSAVPAIWGRVRIKSPNVCYLGGRAVEVVEVDGEEVAFEYGVRALQLVLGVPGRGHEIPTLLTKVWIGEKVLWQGVLGTENGNEFVTIDEPNFLGGPGKGGGVEGQLFYLPGSASQTIHAQLEADYAATADETLLSPLRGLAQVWLTNWNLGEDPIPQGLSAEVRASCVIQDFAGELNPIGDGDANPVNVIYDIITNPIYGIGLLSSQIDLDSFYAAGQVLETEGNGFSMYLENAQDAPTILGELQQQIDAFIYQDPVTRKITIKLCRDDYDVGDLDSFDETNLVDATLDQTTWESGRIINRVHLEYTDRSVDYGTRTVMEQDLASIAAHGVHEQVFRFPGIHDAANASRVAARILRSVSLPLTSVRFVADRHAHKLVPGAVVKWSWTFYNEDGTVARQITDMVLRVGSVDYGELGNGKIAVHLVEDRFAFDSDAYEQPEFENTDPLPVRPPLERWVEEAPRWMTWFAWGALGQDPDVPRGFYVAVPFPDLPTNSPSTFYRAERQFIALWQDDTGSIGYPGRAIIDAFYPRTLDPYDTTDGITIRDLEGITLANADSAADIKNFGVNTMLVVSEDGTRYEFLAFETVTDNLDGTYLLEDVWRGLGDSVPMALQEGDRVYFLANSNGMRKQPIGDNALPRPPSADVRMPGGGPGFVLPPDGDLRFVDTITKANRALCPYPVADLEVDGEKDLSITEEGVEVTWRQRDNQTAVLIRGDYVSQSVEAGTEYDIVAQKVSPGEDPYAPASTFELDEVIVDTGVTGTSVDDVPLAEAGYGTIAVKVRTKLDVTLPDDTVASLSSWRDPAITVVCPEWRNLLRNPRFEGELTTHWTVTSGAIEAFDLLIDGGMIFAGAGSSATSDFNQVVNVAGYLPARMTAILDWIAINANGDADDTLRVDLISLDASDSVLQTITYGPTAQSATQKNHRNIAINIASGGLLDPDTAKLKVRVLCTAVTDSRPDSVVSQFVLTLGQITSQLLTNPDFEAGTFTGWTNASNSFVADTTAPLYTAAQYARPGDFASSEIQQDVSIPAGFEIGATAVLRLHRMNQTPDAGGADTGEVIVEIRDGGGVLASVTTGAEAISPVDTWVPRTLAVDIPQGATTVRTRILGTRVGGTTCDTCFDDVNLRIHKKLDTTIREEIEFVPVVQPLPKTVFDWEIAFPGVPAPDYGLWNGETVQGQIGIEPDMEADAADVVENGTMVGVFGADDDETACTTCAFDFIAGNDGDLHSITPTTYANFDSDDAFTVMVVFKALHYDTALDSGLIGRVGTTGWEMRFDSSEPGFVVRLVGESDEASVLEASGSYVSDGGVRYAAMVYDPTAAELRLVTPAGEQFGSTTGLGEIRCNEQVRFRIGRGSTGIDTFIGQIARVYIWRSALATADIQSLWTHGGDPSAGDATLNSITPIACVVGSDATGVRVARFGAGQRAIGWGADLGDGGGEGYGIPSFPPMTNLVPTATQVLSSDAIHWDASGGTLTPDQLGPEGLYNAMLVVGTNAQGTTMLDLPVTADPNVLVVWFARAQSGSHSARLTLLNESDVSKGTHDFAVTSTWQRYEHLFTTWDDSTADCRLRWSGSDTGASQGIYLAGPFYVSQDTRVPIAFPYTADEADLNTFTLAYDMIAHHNVEGEIAVTGVCAVSDPGAGVIFKAGNGTNNNDRKELYASATEEAKFDHYDSTGTAVTSETAAAQDWGSQWTIRGRWNRAGLLEADTAYAGVVFGNDTGSPMDHDRSSAFTASTTVLDELQVGNPDGTDGLHMLVRKIVITARETRLRPP